MSAFDGPAAVAMMMHAVGDLKHFRRYRRKPPYRNHFCASSEDVPAWEVLVSMGLATRREVVFVPEPTYFVTPAGLAFLRELRKAKRAK